MIYNIGYNALFLPLALLLLYGPGLLVQRLRKNLLARHGCLTRLAKDLKAKPLPPTEPGRPRVWIHCASMGEYEAIRPLAAALRKKGCGLVLSFFSISGMQNLPDEHEFDHVSYLPLDRPRSMRTMVKLIQPDVFVVTKHDLWWNLIRALNRADVPLLFINANFHQKAHLRHPLLRGFYRRLLAHFSQILPVSNIAAQRFERLLEGTAAARRITVMGETRFDRVLAGIRSSTSDLYLPEAFRSSPLITVAGSSWQKGEEQLIPAWAACYRHNDGLRLLLVPHEPTEAHIRHSQKLLAAEQLSSVCLSQLGNAEVYRGQPVIIVDRIGVLAGMYRCARLAYVGGGFTTGVHSVIEPAAFAAPVFFGANHHVSQEASLLLDAGAACETTEPAAMQDWITQMMVDGHAHRNASVAALGVVKKFAGASERILEQILACNTRGRNAQA